MGLEHHCEYRDIASFRLARAALFPNVVHIRTIKYGQDVRNRRPLPTSTKRCLGVDSMRYLSSPIAQATLASASQTPPVAAGMTVRPLTSPDTEVAVVVIVANVSAYIFSC